MAVILNQITVGDLRILVLDSAPNTGSGISVELGSLSMIKGQTGIWQKTGAGSTDWKLSSIDAAQLGLDLADLDSRLDTLELDPVTKTYVDTEVSGLDGRLDTLELDPVSKTYVDTEVSGLDGRLDALELDPVTKAYVDAADAAIDARLDAVEVTEEVIEGDNLASLPATGEASKIYVAKDTNKLYRWASVGVPAVYDWTVGSGGDFATLQEALASASVQNGDNIKVLAGTYTVSSAITVDKQVGIFGEGIGQTIIQTAGAGSDPVNVVIVTADNVTLYGMTIKHRKTTNTSIEAAVTVSAGAWPNFTYPVNFIMDSCQIEHAEFGLVIRGDSFKLANNTFAYRTGSLSNSNRCIGLYGHIGNCFIVDNIFDNSTINGTAFRAIYSTSTNGSSNEDTTGNLVIKGNSHVGLLQQFYLQDNVRGPANSMALYISDNVTNETSVFSAVYLSTENQMDLFSEIILTNNSISNNHEAATGLGKGLFALDGAGSNLFYRSSNLPVHASGNTLGQVNFRADYAEAVGSLGSLVGYKPSVFSTVEIILDESIPTFPTAPATPNQASFSEDYQELSPTDPSVESRLDALEADPVTKSYVDTQDASTLSSAQAYADQKVADLVNSAPAVLDTLKELSDALGGDANFATTIAGQIGDLDSRLDTLELDPVTKTYVDSADSALDSRLDTLEADPVTKTYVDNQISTATTSISNLESFKNAQLVYVSKSGNDSTGTGGQHKPYATISAALASITDASPTKRYLVKVEAGAYTETTLSLKANVFIAGEQKEAVRLTVTTLNMASDFSGSADNRSGMARIIIASGNANFDWATVTSAAGKLYFTEVAFGGTVTMNGHNNAIAQAQFESCVFFNTFTVSGINVSIHNNNIHYGSINLNQHPNGGMATILAASGGRCDGTVTLTTTVNDFNRRCALFAKNFYMEYVTVSGASSYADMNEGSLPRSRDRISASNGGNVVYITTKTPHVSNSVNIGEPGYQYLYNFSYVHGSTDTDLYVVSMGSAYSAANTGRSIFIESDTYGLNADVNGGDINLTTASVSGTGVRGKIKLDAKEVDLSSKKITNLADPTAAQDAATKAYVDSQSAAALSSAEDYTDQKVADLVNSAPAVLDTLKELSDALGGDANFATTVAGQIGDLDDKIDQEILDRAAADALKLDLAGGTMSGDINMGSNDLVSVGSIGLGSASPESIFELVDNNVKYNMKGYSTSTSGAVNAVIASIAPAADTVTMLKIMITGMDSSSKDSVMYERTVRIKNQGGTLSLGTIQSDYTNEDMSLTDADCDILVNASNVDIRVTGVDAKTINWKCLLQKMV